MLWQYSKDDLTLTKNIISKKWRPFSLKYPNSGSINLRSLVQVFLLLYSYASYPVMNSWIFVFRLSSVLKRSLYKKKAKALAFRHGVSLLLDISCPRKLFLNIKNTHYARAHRDVWFVAHHPAQFRHHHWYVQEME